MGEWVSSTLGFLERIPKIAFQVSVPLIAIGGSLMAAIRLGLVRESAFQGYVADAGPVALSIGFAILLVGLLFAAFDMVQKVPRWVSTRKADRAGLQRLLENMRFLPDDALFVMLEILNQPSSRVPSFGDIPSISALSRLSLVAAEGAYSSATDRGTMIQANPLLGSDRVKVKGYIRTLLVGRGNSLEALLDNAVVSNRAHAAMRKELDALDSPSRGW